MQKRRRLTEGEQRAAIQAIACVNFRDISGGDGIAAQIERVKQSGIWPRTSYLWRALWHALGGSEPRPRAENLIIFGCMRLFWQGPSLISYLTLLDRLGVDYTFLGESELCCGSGIIQDALARGTLEEQRAAWEAGRQFTKLNIDQGRALGAKNVYYFCQACARQAMCFVPGDAIPQRYHLDLVVDRIERSGIALRMKKPTTAAYYQGCWRKYDYLYPGAGFNLPVYRKLAGRIEGLEIRDISPTTCCWTSAPSVFKAAEKLGVDTIVTICTACQRNLDRIAPKEHPVKVRMLHDVILEAL